MSKGLGIKRVKAFIASHPVVFIAVVGLVIRACLIPFFTYTYDVYHWALTISNLRSGEGLYGLSGYYYTPVWGYFLAGIGSIADLLNIADFGDMFYSLAFVNGSEWDYYHALVCTPAFTMLVKSILTIFDLVTGYLIYVLVKDHTGNDKKATAAFGLWFLCPIVIYTSAIHGMFDVIAVMTLVLTVLLLFRRRYGLAGAVFAVSIFTKFFPFYLTLILLVLVIKQEKEPDARRKALMMVVLGFFMMFILIYLPQIIDGTFLDTFSFITSRVAEVSVGSESKDVWDLIQSIGFSVVIMLQVAIFAVLFVIAQRTYRLPQEGSEFVAKYMHRLMLSTAVIFLWTPTPTYLMILLPFLAYAAVTRDDDYVVPFILISVFSTLYSLAMHNYSVLFQLYGYFGVVPLEYLVDGIGWFDGTLFSITNRTLINILLGLAETLSIYSVYLFTYRGYMKRNPKEVKV
jgi:hypothetical protein